jgi:putative transposase
MTVPSVFGGVKYMENEFEWRTGRSCVYKIFLHVVFVTKYRRGVLTKEMLDRMKDIFSETLLQFDGELLEFNGEDDHVHLLLSMPPKTAISNLVGKLKGKSSYFIRREYWDHVKKKLWGTHFWSPSYCVVSCGGAPLDIVKAYVEEQRTPPSELQLDRSKRFTNQTRVNGAWVPQSSSRLTRP